MKEQEINRKENYPYLDRAETSLVAANKLKKMSQWCFGRRKRPFRLFRFGLKKLLPNFALAKQRYNQRTPNEKVNPTRSLARSYGFVQFMRHNRNINRRFRPRQSAWRNYDIHNHVIVCIVHNIGCNERAWQSA